MHFLASLTKCKFFLTHTDGAFPWLPFIFCSFLLPNPNCNINAIHTLSLCYLTFDPKRALLLVGPKSWPNMSICQNNGPHRVRNVCIVTHIRTFFAFMSTSINGVHWIRTRRQGFLKVSRRFLQGFRRLVNTSQKVLGSINEYTLTACKSDLQISTNTSGGY